LANQKITALTAKTALSLTDVLPIVDLDAAAVTKKATLQNVRGGYVLELTCSPSSPADATTYYLGSLYGSALHTTATGSATYIPRDGTITSIQLWVRVAGTLGSAETSTMSLRLNNTTDTTISTGVLCNAIAQHLAATVSVAVTTADYIEIKWVSPTFATNPTNVTFHLSIYVS
jgi:hypothetical protein